MHSQPIQWHKIEMVLAPGIPYGLTANVHGPFQLHRMNAIKHLAMDHNAHKNTPAVQTAVDSFVDAFLSSRWKTERKEREKIRNFRWNLVETLRFSMNLSGK